MRRELQALAWLLLIDAVAQPALAGVCDADLNHDGTVNTLDLGILLSSWTLPPAAACAGSACSADINGDGAVNSLDLGQLLVAWDAKCPPPPPRVVITPVAHSGDPAPGIDWPSAYYGVLLTPEIDAQGNVLFLCFLGGTGLGEIGNLAIFYGQPGRVTKLIWETDHAPGMAPGVIIKNLFSAEERLCEAGVVSYGAIVQGPGITPGVNDMAIFYGDPRIPGDIHKIIQTGDQAPGLVPGVTLKYSTTGTFFGTWLSDNGTMMFFSRLAGPEVTSANDYAIWTAMPGKLQLVWRTGIQAPGTPPGVTFTWADFFSINDSGQIALRGDVTGPGIIDGYNNEGRWLGGPGALEVYAWPDLIAPGLPTGITFGRIPGMLTCLNDSSDMYAIPLLQGPGVTTANDQAFFIGPPGKLSLVLREGEPAPQTQPGVVVADIENVFINAERDCFFPVRFAGPSIDATNNWAFYFGAPDEPHISLRDGDHAPQFPPDVQLAHVVFGLSLTALNDVGDVITVTEITGPGITSQNKVVLWRRDAALQQWYPLLQGNQTIDGRVISLPATTALGGWYWQSTGGSDGFGLSFNDAGQLVLKIKFTDGSHGVYLLQVETQRQ